MYLLLTSMVIVLSMSRWMSPGLQSTTKNGKSKIVPFLKEGAGVVTTRAHLQYVVTEYGVAYLYGKNLRQRSYELLRIAAPEHQEDLEKSVFARFGSYNHPMR